MQKKLFQGQLIKKNVKYILQLHGLCMFLCPLRPHLLFMFSQHEIMHILKGKGYGPYPRN